MTKILLVDDEPDVELLARQKFRKQIEEGTFQLFFALNGQEALNLIDQHPDIVVVVSDVNMPEMDGLTLIDKLRTLNPAIKTIVVSAYGDTKTLREAMNKGVSDFVTKPVDFKDLQESILRAIEQYQPQASPLHTYQLFLAQGFPKRLDLNVPHGESKCLWDAIVSENEETLCIMGVAMVPAPIPFDIGMTVCHTLLKTSLYEDPAFSIKEFNNKLHALNPFVKAHILIGHYHIKSKTFSYETNADARVSQLSSEKERFLPPSQTTLLRLGDVISLEMPDSLSRLSFAEIEAP